MRYDILVSRCCQNGAAVLPFLIYNVHLFLWVRVVVYRSILTVLKRGGAALRVMDAVCEYERENCAPF